MKKFVAMVMMAIMILTAANGLAESTAMPKIHLNDLDNMSWSDDYDLHITMYMSIPEYESVRFELSVSFNDNEWQNYNSGVAKLYDNNTGEYIDEVSGNLAKEIDCSSKDVETVRKNMVEYIENYDFEADAEKGLKYYSIWF